MPEDEVPKTRLRAIEALYEFLEGAEEDVTSVPLERVLKELQKEKLDPAPLIQMVRDRLTAARATETLAQAREQRMRMDRLRALDSGVLDGDIAPAIRQLTRERDEARATSARLEGLILDWDNENTSTDDWRRACESLEAEAHRIRAQRGGER